MEVIVSSISDKFKAPRKVVLTWVTLVGFTVSLLFVTGAGLYILDLVDHFINTYAIAISGLIEIIFLGWFLNLEEVRAYANGMSDFNVGKWWNFSLRYLTPVLLFIMFIFNTYTDFTKGYDTYKVSALAIIGGGTLVILFILSYLFSKIRGDQSHELFLGKGVDIREY
jgi:NSS family neurotransmitter:Na+ symporter